MKLILSRKGFDSAAGGGPSPILPDDRPVSLPIPAPDERRYRDVRAPDGLALDRLLAKLGVSERVRRGGCHLDPDLDERAVEREPGWRPAFGSVGAAGSHLAGQGVGPGDLFLFFGWFRRFEVAGRKLRAVPGSDVHMIFGYLQVGRVYEPSSAEELPSWLRDHPHARPRLIGSTGNVLYTATDRLTIPGRRSRLPGAGLLPWSSHRVLTAPGKTRSRWSLPRAVFGDRQITYHSQRSWREGHFQAAGRGQEFVLEVSPAVLEWAAAILGEHGSGDNPTQGTGDRGQGEVASAR